MDADTEKVRIELSKDEAIVFFEWLSRFNATGSNEFADQAEQRVLWDIESQLETLLVEPMADDYDKILSGARARVRDPEGG